MAGTYESLLQGNLPHNAYNYRNCHHYTSSTVFFQKFSNGGLMQVTLMIPIIACKTVNGRDVV